MVGEPWIATLEYFGHVFEVVQSIAPSDHFYGFLIMPLRVACSFPSAKERWDGNLEKRESFLFPPLWLFPVDCFIWSISMKQSELLYLDFQIRALLQANEIYIKVNFYWPWLLDLMLRWIYSRLMCFPLCAGLRVLSLLSAPSCVFVCLTMKGCGNWLQYKVLTCATKEHPQYSQQHRAIYWLQGTVSHIVFVYAKQTIGFSSA